MRKNGSGILCIQFISLKHHRNLIIRRHSLTEYANVKLRGCKGQTTSAHYKYKDAIAACDSTEYIEYNISQIARIFDVDCSSLASQLADIILKSYLAENWSASDGYYH